MWKEGREVFPRHLSLATSAERKRRYRERCKQEGREDVTRRNATNLHREWKRRQPRSQTQRPFTGCDGEGAGVDVIGRQLYLLFRMGERELFTGDRLRTEELLNFICDHPAGDILVGFAFGYDVTMILRDLPEAQAKRLFQPIKFEQGFSPYVWYKDFDLQYLPKQYFKVRRVRIERDDAGRERRKVVAGSTRVIYETFGFFQKSFLKVVQEFGVGTEADRKLVAESKARRSEFEHIGEVERHYCGLECSMLAELMEKLRGFCNDADIVPRSWNGAGKFAGALHRDHDTLQASSLAGLVGGDLLEFGGMAYYGGRFEISRIGAIKERVFEYDIRSAYPDAMRRLPCLVHGTWRRATGKELRSLAHDLDRRGDALFVAGCAFEAGNFDKAQFGGLPVRSPEGHLYWPLQGSGIYWSPEIISAQSLGFKIVYKDGFLYQKNCDCQPFDWIEPLYEYRRSIGSSGPGYPIKLGINALYGLLAQRVGAGKFANLIWAGLITAMTRARLNDAIALAPDKIFMVATDAVYSTVRLAGLDCGEALGSWEASELDGLFVVQPGLYWCPARRKKKSRGLSGKFFETPGLTESFESAWERYRQEQNSRLLTDFPAVSVPVPSFIGLKLAMSRNRPETAGRWIEDSRVISFDYRNKRQSHVWCGEHVITRPKAGYRGLVSLPHREFLKAGGQEPWEAARLMLEEQPDYVDLGIPFKD